MERRRESSRERKPDSLGREESQDEINGRIQRRDFREGLFSIFIDNLNPDVKVKDLWSFFKVYGRVKDVFLSAKNSHRRSNFAFVRFGSLEEASMVANTANGRQIYGWPIVSKLAAVGWKNRHVLALRRRGLRMVKSEETAREPGYCSLAEAVKEGDSRKFEGESNQEENLASMPWSRPKEVEEWVSRCAVGILREFSHVTDVNQRLNAQGFKFYSSYLGDKSILWVFESECEREGFIKNRFFWNDCFCSMTRWSDSLTAKSRITWINVFGTPLSYWSADFFEEVGRKVGEYLLVDEETVMRGRVDKGRILVLVPHDKPCLSKIKVLSGEGSFIVRIEEELSLVANSWLVQFLDLKPPCAGFDLYPNKESLVAPSWKKMKRDKKDNVLSNSKVGVQLKERDVLTEISSVSDANEGGQLKERDTLSERMEVDGEKRTLDSGEGCWVGKPKLKALPFPLNKDSQVLENSSDIFQNKIVVSSSDPSDIDLREGSNPNFKFYRGSVCGPDGKNMLGLQVMDIISDVGLIDGESKSPYNFVIW